MCKCHKKRVILSAGYLLSAYVNAERTSRNTKFHSGYENKLRVYAAKIIEGIL